jgi:hypothetical protein
MPLDSDIREVTQAIESLRPVMGELKVAEANQAVQLSLCTDFETFTTFKPAALHEPIVDKTLDEVTAWGGC